MCGRLRRCAFRCRCFCAQAVPALVSICVAGPDAKSFGITCLVNGATNRRLVVWLAEEFLHILSAWFRCAGQGYRYRRGTTMSPMHALETLGAQDEGHEGRSMKRNCIVHCAAIVRGWRRYVRDGR
jgi:hypothetical protein